MERPWMDELKLKVESYDNITTETLNRGMGNGFETGAVVYEGPMLSEVRTHCYNPHTMLELGLKKFGEVFPVGNVEAPRPYMDADWDEAFNEKS